MDNYLNKVSRGISLSQQEAFEAFSSVLSGGADAFAIRDLLVCLSKKGEASEEIAGCALAMRKLMVKVSLSSDSPIIDNCGTGGDAFKTANISTPAALIAASCGVKVAKHGNRSVTGRCGSADLLEALGVGLSQDAARAAACFSSVGMCFLFAPYFHPHLKPLKEVRKSIGSRTIFNLVGPLCNPAQVRRQVIGAPTPSIASKMAQALQHLGTDNSVVICGRVGEAAYIDEFSPSLETVVFRVGASGVEQFQVTPGDFGMRAVKPSLLHPAETVPEAAVEVRGIFGGNTSKRSGALLSAYAMNASAALLVSGKMADFSAGAEAAIESVRSGRAIELLSDFLKSS